MQKEVRKQILFEVANVLQDPEICDTIFIVGDGIERQEIRAEPACESKEIKVKKD